MSRRRTINSVDEMRTLAPSIIESLNSQSPERRLAAAANPLLALADLGYDLAPEVAQDIEERARFSKRQLVARRTLQTQLRKAAGREVDVTDRADLERLLRDDLKLRDLGCGELDLPRDRETKDPLRAVKRHPVIDIAIKLRALERETRRFASAELYQSLKEGRRTLPSVSVKARLASERADPHSSRRRAKAKGSRNA